MTQLKSIIISLAIIALLTPFIVFAGTADVPKSGTDGTVTLSNPLPDSISSPQLFIGKIIGISLGVVGSLALLMFIYGGFTWMTSAGAADKVTKGKGIMVWAAIGLAVIFSSYALVKFVITNLTKTT